MQRRHFQFSISALLGLTTVAAVVVWLGVYHMGLLGVLFFLFGVAVVLLLMFLIRIGVLWAFAIWTAETEIERTDDLVQAAVEVSSSMVAGIEESPVE